MKFWINIFLSFVFMCFAACNVPFGKDDSVVVSVGDSKLYMSDLHRYYPFWDSLSDRQKLTHLESWIDEETILQEAYKSRLDKDPVLLSQIELMKRKMIVNKFLQSFEDTMVVRDAEKLDYYNENKDKYVRGKNYISGALLYFKDWNSADTYYKGHKNAIYDSLPNSHYLIKKIEVFDSVSVSPDSCLISDFSIIETRKLYPMKLCAGALKMFVVTEKLDSADILPYDVVAESVSEATWFKHRKQVYESLKKELKKTRPIFTQKNPFSPKEEK